jgi:hypothetical protein
MAARATRGRITAAPNNKDKGILAPEQYTFKYQEGKPVGRPIKNGVPITIYLPADPLRRKRLLRDIRRINQARNDKSSAS